MELYSGLDLHSTNTYIGILDTDFKRVFKKRVSNDLDLILGTLEPFKDQLKGLVVESTYNWCSTESVSRHQGVTNSSSPHYNGL